MQNSQGLLLLHSSIIPSSGLKIVPDAVEEVMLNLAQTLEMKNININKYIPVISLCEKLH